MTALEKIRQYKSFPSTLIVNGLTSIGIQIAKTLLEQKGLVIILDKYTKENKSRIDKLSKFDSFVFVDINGEENLLSNLKNLSYLIYLENEKIEKQNQFSPKEFLQKISSLNKFLEFSINQSTKVLVTTSLKIHQLSLANYAQKEYDPKTPVYSDIEQQRYVEKFCFNLHDKFKLDIRIIRLSEVYGPNILPSKISTFGSLLLQCVRSKYLKIYGDGLEENLIIHINDATYGILKALFSPNTSGEVFNLANYEDISTLSIAYALLETNGKAKEIKFLASKKKIVTAPLDPTPNLSKIGWKPRVNLVKGLSEIIKKPLTNTSTIQEVISKKKKSIWRKTFEFFFVTEEQFQIQQIKKSKKTNILDKLSSNTVKQKRVKNKPTLAKKIKKKDFLNKFKINRQSKRTFLLNWKKYTFRGSLLLVFYMFLFAPLIGYVSSLGFAATNSYRSVVSLKSNDYEKLSVNLNNLEKNLSKSQNSLQKLKWAFEILRKEDSINNMDNFLAGVRHLARGGKQSLELVQPILGYAQNLTLNLEDENNYTEYMESIYTNAQEFDVAYIELIKAKELLSSVDYNFFVLSEKQSDSIRDLETEIFSKVLEYKDFISVMPQLLGYPEEKNYLILLQNNFELRSTGGFIGSYATVTVNNGKLANIKVDDIYNPDGQLDEFVEPPEPLKRLIGDSGWAMRDANWDPDFQIAARQIEWFYKLETGKDIDGVIAINTNIIQELLEKIGSVTLEDGKIITKENFFEESEAHHITFEPGSTDKKDFLGNLTTGILEKLGERDHEALIDVGLLAEEMLNTREVFIYFNNPAAQRIITERGWSGSLEQKDGEYLFVVENNLGANKVNKYIERKTKENINITEDSIQNELTIEYTNNSDTNEWPGGKYVNYVQTIIPIDSDIQKIEGIENSVIEERYGYKIVSGWFEVDYQEQNSFTIIYNTNSIEDKPIDKKLFNYFLQKQSGISESYVEIEITYPDNWTVLKNESELTQKIENDTLRYFGLQNKDSFIDLEFKQQN